MKKLLFIICLLLGFVQSGFCADYFVSSSTGNDTTGDGSAANPWATVTKVNNTTFATGDDVYFKCGDTWSQQQLSVDWDGTALNKAIIGAYYGSGTIGVSGNLPVLDGEEISPRSEYKGLINIGGDGTIRTHVTVENIRLINSTGNGVRAEGYYSGGTGYLSSYVTVSNVETYNTYKSGIVNYRATNGLIENCTVSRAGMLYRNSRSSTLRVNSQGYSLGAWMRCVQGTTTYLLVCTSAGTSASSQPTFSTTIGTNTTDGSVTWNMKGVYTTDWPQAVGGTQDSSYTTVRNCTVTNSFTEGIGFYKASDNCLAENNLVYNCSQAGIYAADGGKNNIIRYNLVYGTIDSTYYRWISSQFINVGTGILIGDEGWVTYRSEGNEIYGNFVAYTAAGIRFESNTFTAAGTKIYNNTFAGNTTAIAVSSNCGWASSEIRNNIFYQAEGTRLYSGPSTTPGLTWSNNLWSSSVDDFPGTGDVIGNPLLAKSTGWRSLTAGSLSASDFALRSTSPAIDTGYLAELTFPHTVNVYVSTYPDNVSLVNQAGNGAGFEIGAATYRGGGEIEDPATGFVLPRNLTETIMRTAGVTITLTTDATWDATIGADNALTTALIAAMGSNRSEATGWDAIVKAGLTHANVTRTSDSVVTIVIPAFATFDISVSETISTVIPASCTSAGATITCNNFVISAIQAATVSRGMLGSSTAGDLLRSESGSTLRHKE